MKAGRFLRKLPRGWRWFCC